LLSGVFSTDSGLLVTIGILWNRVVSGQKQNSPLNRAASAANRAIAGRKPNSLGLGNERVERAKESGHASSL